MRVARAAGGSRLLRQGALMQCGMQAKAIGGLPLTPGRQARGG